MALIASRQHVGMTDIIEHIGRTSGIDAALYAATDRETASKIISVARYLLASDGDSLPGILTWQLNHALPCEEGLSADVCRDLFAAVGRDETLRQSFFSARAAALKAADVLAYDFTVESAYSAGQPEVLHGFCESGDDLKSIKLVTLYAVDSRQPVAFTKQPGNLPDVVAVETAVKQLGALGVKTTEVVTDSGYYSEKNLSDLLQAGLDFVTPVKTDIKWVQAEIDAHMGELQEITNVYPRDISTHGISAVITHRIAKTRKYSGDKNGLSLSDDESASRRIYVNVYFNMLRQAEDMTAFFADLMELKSLVEGGKTAEELSASARIKATKYLLIRKRGGRIHVAFNEKACAYARKYHGYFVLVTNKERDPFECLRKYRRRETVAAFFAAGKQKTAGARARGWDQDTLRGRRFVQFVGLCYHDCLAERVRLFKETQGRVSGASERGQVTQPNAERELKAWLERMPLYLQLQWFDVSQAATVPGKAAAERWTAEIAARDKLYLAKLGVLR